MDNNLSMTRGDTATFHFHREDATGAVITDEADGLYFTVKKSFKDTNFVLQKTKLDMTFDDNFEYHFTIEPADTNNLDFGRYAYDIEVIAENVKTTIAKGYFSLTEEVTYASNETEG